MTFTVTVIVLILLKLTSNCNGARILGVVTTPSYSHQEVFHPLWKQLSLRGHQVTVLTTNPIKDPTLTNLTEIDLHFMYEMQKKQKSELHKKLKENVFGNIGSFVSTVSGFVDAELQFPEVQKLIKNETEHFDLVIMEYFLSITAAFGTRFNCPVIAMTTVEASNNLHEVMGSWSHSVVTPEIIFAYFKNLSFWERLMSSYFALARVVLYRYYSSNLQDVVAKNFGKDYPDILSIEKNISMVFVNTNPIINVVRPLVPTIIEIGGGIHLREPKKLPEKLQMFLDSASKGFIYFSLGTNAKSAELSKTLIMNILEVFADLPYKVIWKFETAEVLEKPSNVLMSTWFPQQDVLRHPNIKLFITQGGMQSLEEALYIGVPVLGMPIYGNQFYNVKLYVHKGLGLSVNYKNLNKDEFRTKILILTENSKYRNNAKKLARLALDQPMTGLEKAIWWSEYVIRHKGTRHLRSPALDLPAYQYYLLDVIGFSALLIFAIFYLFIKVIQFSWRLVKRKQKLE